MSGEKLEDYIKTGKYLFHITDGEGYDDILKSGYVLPLTFDGSREMYGLVKRGEEKKTTSFTSNPIELFDNDVFAFKNKKLVMIFDREKLVERDVRPVIYVDDKIFKEKHGDYRYCIDDCDYECEWRSIDKVYIMDAYEGFINLES